MKESIIKSKSVSFAIRIINLYKFLAKKKNEFVLGNQLLRSGTAIGALISEGKYAQSKADFIHKYHIAIKEANETAYWLLLLSETGYINKEEYDSMKTDCEELIKLLTSSIKTAKQNLK